MSQEISPSQHSSISYITDMLSPMMSYGMFHMLKSHTHQWVDISSITRTNVAPPIFHTIGMLTASYLHSSKKINLFATEFFCLGTTTALLPLIGKSLKLKVTYPQTLLWAAFQVTTKLNLLGTCQLLHRLPLFILQSLNSHPKWEEKIMALPFVKACFLKYLTLEMVNSSDDNVIRFLHHHEIINEKVARTLCEKFIELNLSPTPFIISVIFESLKEQGSLGKRIPFQSLLSFAMWEEKIMTLPFVKPYLSKHLTLKILNTLDNNAIRFLHRHGIINQKVALPLCKKFIALSLPSTPYFDSILHSILQSYLTKNTPKTALLEGNRLHFIIILTAWISQKSIQNKILDIGSFRIAIGLNLNANILSAFNAREINFLYAHNIFMSGHEDLVGLYSRFFYLDLPLKPTFQVSFQEALKATKQGFPYLNETNPPPSTSPKWTWHTLDFNCRAKKWNIPDVICLLKHYHSKGVWYPEQKSIAPSLKQGLLNYNAHLQENIYDFYKLPFHDQLLFNLAFNKENIGALPYNISEYKGSFLNFEKAPYFDIFLKQLHQQLQHSLHTFYHLKSTKQDELNAAFKSHKMSPIAKSAPRVSNGGDLDISAINNGFIEENNNLKSELCSN